MSKPKAATQKAKPKKLNGAQIGAKIGKILDSADSLAEYGIAPSNAALVSAFRKVVA